MHSNANTILVSSVLAANRFLGRGSQVQVLMQEQILELVENGVQGWDLRFGYAAFVGGSAHENLPIAT